MTASDENSALLEALEQTRITAEEIERRVAERRRRATNPYLAAVRLPPPPAVPAECDEQRVWRSEAPTLRMRSPVVRDAEPPPTERGSTRYSIVNGRSSAED